LSLILWLAPAVITVAGTIALLIAASAMGDETRLLRLELARVASLRDDARSIRDELRRTTRG
jgi:hypothetical protein